MIQKFFLYLCLHLSAEMTLRWLMLVIAWTEINAGLSERKKRSQRLKMSRVSMGSRKHLTPKTLPFQRTLILLVCHSYASQVWRLLTSWEFWISICWPIVQPYLFIYYSCCLFVFHGLNNVSACEQAVMKAAVTLMRVPLLCMAVWWETELLAVVTAPPAREGSWKKVPLPLLVNLGLSELHTLLKFPFPPKWLSSFSLFVWY